jgi:hypothetical protein
MPRVTCRSWTAEQIELLCALVDRGVSPARASVVLKRPRLAVQTKAREVGRPFTDSRQIRANRLAREASERKAIDHAALKPSGLHLFAASSRDNLQPENRTISTTMTDET